MKLKEFNKENSASAKSGDSVISFNIGAGLVSFSSTATEILGLKKGMEIVLVQDEDKPIDWYWAEKKGGFPLRQDKDDKRLAFNNTKTVKEMAKSLGIETSSFRCFLGITPVVIDKVKYFPIITQSAKSK